MVEPTTIPVLDFTSNEGIEEKVLESCLSTGLFYIINHGMEIDKLNNVLTACRRYFSLPQEVGLNEEIQEICRFGFLPFGENSQTGFNADRHEAYDLMTNLPLNSPYALGKEQQYAVNRWPPQSPWLRTLVEPYFNTISEITRKLLSQIALSLMLPKNFFCPFLPKPIIHTRLLHYLSTPFSSKYDTTVPSDYGIFPQTDFGLVTILLQSELGGLEVRTKAGEWVHAPLKPGAFMINLGDILSTLTNGSNARYQNRIKPFIKQKKYSPSTFNSLDLSTQLTAIDNSLIKNLGINLRTTTPAEYNYEHYCDSLKKNSTIMILEIL